MSRLNALAAGACVFALSPLCLAGEVPDERQGQAAEQRFRAGVEAYTSGRYVEAIALFREADQIRSSPALSLNIARAYAKLGDDASALQAYRTYLRRAPAAADANQIRVIVDGLEEDLAKRGVQQVTVLTEPPGATVTVDGQPVGVTPWTSEITPGTHHLSLRRHGYSEVDRGFELTRNDSLELSATLVALPGTPPYSASGSNFAQGAVTTGAPDAIAEEPRTKRTLGFVALGVAGGALAGATIFEVLRKSAADDARDEPRQLEAGERLDSADSHAAASRVLLGVGAAFAVTGGVLLLLDAKQTPTTPQLSLGCRDGLCGAMAFGRFQ